MAASYADEESFRRRLQATLIRQAHDIERLSGELAKSYQTEIAFLDMIDRRDAEAREELARRQKKIWWLESELRRTTQQRRDFSELAYARGREIDRLNSRRPGLGDAKRMLKSSVPLKVKRQYWQVRKRMGS